jgi:hypothetical protein
MGAVATACQSRSSVIQALRESISNRLRASAGRRSGSEARVHVQTMIAQETRDILVRHHVTLAAVFDDCARRLSRVP